MMFLFLNPKVVLLTKLNRTATVSHVTETTNVARRKSPDVKLSKLQLEMREIGAIA